MTGSIGEACEFCGVDNWEISATLIECRGCGALWGRVNGVWILTEPEKK